jgi:hypothetical protein
VEVNVRSPARWLNDARYGARDVQVPPQADAAAPPQWEVVARDGTYAWHDHRIHVMTPVLPAQVDPTAGTVQRVWDVAVPIEVDGQVAEVRIDLDWVPGPSPVVAGSFVLLLMVALVALFLERSAAAPPVVATVALAALVLGLATWLANPPGGDVEPAVVVLPALALALQAVGHGLARRRPGTASTSATAGGLVTRPAGVAWPETGAVVPLAVWGVLLAPALVRPIVPGPVPVWLVRGITAATLAVAMAVVVLTSPAIAHPAADGAARLRSGRVAAYPSVSGSVSVSVSGSVSVSVSGLGLGLGLGFGLRLRLGFGLRRGVRAAAHDDLNRGADRDQLTGARVLADHEALRDRRAELPLDHGDEVAILFDREDRVTFGAVDDRWDADLLRAGADQQLDGRADRDLLPRGRVGGDHQPLVDVRVVLARDTTHELREPEFAQRVVLGQALERRDRDELPPQGDDEVDLGALGDHRAR